jgi:hypothetical protein
MQCNSVTGKGTQCTRTAIPGTAKCKTHCRTATAKATLNAAANARRKEQDRLFASAAAAAPISPITAKHLHTLNLDTTRHHSPTAIRRAFHQKALQTHPDKSGDPEEFKKVQAAYNGLQPKVK